MTMLRPGNRQRNCQRKGPPKEQRKVVRARRKGNGSTDTLSFDHSHARRCLHDRHEARDGPATDECNRTPPCARLVSHD
jgi:hypothetical protein